MNLKIDTLLSAIGFFEVTFNRLFQFISQIILANSNDFNIREPLADFLNLFLIHPNFVQEQSPNILKLSIVIQLGQVQAGSDHLDRLVLIENKVKVVRVVSSTDYHVSDEIAVAALLVLLLADFPEIIEGFLAGLASFILAAIDEFFLARLDVGVFVRQFKVADVVAVEGQEFQDV
jgi:hypothetical protein